MAQFSKNLWAPWRMAYIRSLQDEKEQGGCFLCSYRDDPQGDRDNHVVWRSPTVFVVMNRFPYTNGHLLIACTRHEGDFTALADDELGALNLAIRDSLRVLRQVLKPDGFNIGYNIGHCAGAGLPDHLHAHVVPRWSGDTNFMAIVEGARVIPDSLDALYAELIQAAGSAGIR